MLTTETAASHQVPQLAQVAHRAVVIAISEAVIGYLCSDQLFSSPGSRLVTGSITA
jgi:hypothetical protein